MDVYDFQSSDQKDEIENHSSNSGFKTGTDNISTDHDRSEARKSKMIKKNYEPIRDGNVYIRYEDDPAQYKKLRKKIQNRQSAARIRGRKKGTIQSLEIQVEDLRKVNSELLLKNATLETENRSLRSEIEFLRGIVKPNARPESAPHDPIDKYLNLGGSSTSGSSMKPEEQFESPFQQEQTPLSWVRSTYSSGARSNWSTIFVLTIVVCVFVLPPDSSADRTVIAQQVDSSQLLPQVSVLEFVVGYGKAMAKYLVILGYLAFAGSFGYARYCRRKLKKF